jgi:hypothetical protein
MTPIALPAARETASKFEAPAAEMHSLAASEHDFAAVMERASAQRTSGSKGIESPREKSSEPEGRGVTGRSTAAKSGAEDKHSAATGGEHASVVFRRTSARDNSTQNLTRTGARNCANVEPAEEAGRILVPQAVQTKTPLTPPSPASNADSSISQDAGDEEPGTGTGQNENPQSNGSDNRNSGNQGNQGGGVTEQTAQVVQCAVNLGALGVNGVPGTGAGDNTQTANKKAGSAQSTPGATEVTSNASSQIGNQAENSGTNLPAAPNVDSTENSSASGGTNLQATTPEAPSASARSQLSSKLKPSENFETAGKQQIEPAAAVPSFAKARMPAVTPGVHNLSSPTPSGPDGTTAASSAVQMKSSSEQNKFADLAAPKEGNEQDATGNDTAGGATGISFPAGFGGDKAFEMFANGPAISVSPAYGLSRAQLDSIGTTGLPARIEQIQGVINREVVTIRQSGADTMAVAVKVDSHTDLLLQLTSRDGQIQAAVRCERGDAGVLGVHWSQLQESLAKQNIHLMPLEDRTGLPLSSAANDSALDSNGRKSQGNGQTGGGDDEAILRNPREAAPAVDKTKSRKSSSKGWESWA